MTIPIRHALRPSQQVIGRYTHLSTSILSLHPSAPHFSHACSTFHHFNHHPNPSSISTDMFASPPFSSTSALSYLPYFTLHAPHLYHATHRSGFALFLLCTSNFHMCVFIVGTVSAFLSPPFHIFLVFVARRLCDCRLHGFSVIFKMFIVHNSCTLFSERSKERPVVGCPYGRVFHLRHPLP